MIGSNLTGKIQLRIYRINNNLEVTYDKKVNVTYGCSSSTFYNALRNFDGYKNYQPSVVRKIYDETGNIITDIGLAAKIDYEVSINLLRPTSRQDETFTTTFFDGYNGQFT